MPITRRAALALPLWLAACGGEEPPPQSFPAPRYDYLPQIRLSVAEIVVDDSWAPRGAGRHVENLAPVMPRDALRQMAQDRLFAAGGPGRAVVVIEDAAITRAASQYVGSFAVRVDVADGGGNLLASAVARATRTRLIGGDSPNYVRSDLYALVRDMMDDMNVELEYQLRRALKDAPQATQPVSPQAEPVQKQDLGGPGGAPAAAPAPSDAGALPPPSPSQMSPPPGNLPGAIPARPL